MRSVTPYRISGLLSRYYAYAKEVSCPNECAWLAGYAGPLLNSLTAV